MNLEVECRTAAEAAAAIRDGDIPLLVASMRLEVSVSARIKCMAGVVTLVALGGAQIRAESWGTSTLNAESWGTSTLNAESRETSTLTAVSRGTSTLTAESRETSTLNAESRETSTLNAVSWETSTLNAESRETSTLNAESRETSTLSAESWETSTLNAESRGYSRICLRGSAKATADKCVSVLLIGDKPQVIGGGFVQRVVVNTAQAWCDYYGVAIETEHAILFKSLDANFVAKWRGFRYEPGTAPECDDWDPKRECGGGLHFSPTPRHALEFYDSPGRRFVACRVALSDIVVHPDGEYPHKCKAPRVAEIWEVDINGRRIGLSGGAAG